MALQQSKQQWQTLQRTAQYQNSIVRWPGVEPGSAAWKATMLTVTPPTLAIHYVYTNN